MPSGPSPPTVMPEPGGWPARNSWASSRTEGSLPTGCRRNEGAIFTSLNSLSQGKGGSSAAILPTAGIPNRSPSCLRPCWMLQPENSPDAGTAIGEMTISIAARPPFASGPAWNATRRPVSPPSSGTMSKPRSTRYKAAVPLSLAGFSSRWVRSRSRRPSLRCRACPRSGRFQAGRCRSPRASPRRSCWWSRFRESSRGPSAR
jgi:hypothetical protein